jgi:hypothetical protein
MKFLIVLAIILLPVEPLRAQRETVPVVLRKVPSETARDMALEAALERGVRGAWLATDRYLYNRVDLNGDGTPEVLVQFRDKELSEAGCKTYVVQRENGTYKIVADFGPMPGNILVSSHATNGWSDLVFSIFNPDLHHVVFEFDGKTYPAHPKGMGAKKLTRYTETVQYISDWIPGFTAGVHRENKYIRGVVVSESGEPLPGVRIQPGRDVRTDARGGFTLDWDKVVVQFTLPGYRPVARVFQRQTDPVTVVLAKNGNDEWIPPACPARVDHRGLGPLGFGRMMFDLPVDAVVRSGRDVDYATSSVQFGKSWLQIGWGLNWSVGFPVLPQYFETASEIQARSIRYESQIPVSEYRGKRTDGTYFRFIGMSGQTIEYDHVPREAAEYFDRILDSLCWAPPVRLR